MRHYLPPNILRTHDVMGVLQDHRLKYAATPLEIFGDGPHKQTPLPHQHVIMLRGNNCKVMSPGLPVGVVYDSATSVCAIVYMNPFPIHLLELMAIRRRCVAMEIAIHDFHFVFLSVAVIPPSSFALVYNPIGIVGPLLPSPPDSSVGAPPSVLLS